LLHHTVKVLIVKEYFAGLNVDADLQDISLGSTSVKAHQHGFGAKKGAILPKLDEFKRIDLHWTHQICLLKIWLVYYRANPFLQMKQRTCSHMYMVAQIMLRALPILLHILGLATKILVS